METATRRALLALVLVAPLLLAPARPAMAQDTGDDGLRQELRASQRRLERIRREREALRREMEAIRSRVHTLASELANIERQVETSADVLSELERQATMLATRIDSITRRLVRTRDRLLAREVVLRHRLRALYKRGPLHTVRVLLGADSFGDLLNRYKYLQLIARHDRMLIEQVERLERMLSAQERQLTSALARLERLRAEKLEAFAQLRRLERKRQNTLEGARQREAETAERLAALAEAERELKGLIARLEARRKEAERARRLAGREPETEETLTTADIGSLDWPVQGELIYRFGPDRQPNGVVLRWNGIGIAAPAGSPVRAVEAGTVAMARPFEGYGPTVMLSHGGGYYTLYLYLRDLRVQRGERVSAGQIIGTVGGASTPEGPHIEFQVRTPTGGGLPEPVDPLTWLKARAGGG